MFQQIIMCCTVGRGEKLINRKSRSSALWSLLFLRWPGFMIKGDEASHCLAYQHKQCEKIILIPKHYFSSLNIQNSQFKEGLLPKRLPNLSWRCLTAECSGSFIESWSYALDVIFFSFVSFFYLALKRHQMQEWLP